MKPGFSANYTQQRNVSVGTKANRLSAAPDERTGRVGESSSSRTVPKGQGGAVGVTVTWSAGVTCRVWVLFGFLGTQVRGLTFKCLHFHFTWIGRWPPCMAQLLFCYLELREGSPIPSFSREVSRHPFPTEMPVPGTAGHPATVPIMIQRLDVHTAVLHLALLLQSSQQPPPRL